MWIIYVLNLGPWHCKNKMLCFLLLLLIYLKMISNHEGSSHRSWQFWSKMTLFLSRLIAWAQHLPVFHFGKGRYFYILDSYVLSADENILFFSCSHFLLPNANNIFRIVVGFQNLGTSLSRRLWIIYFQHIHSACMLKKCSYFVTNLKNVMVRNFPDLTSNKTIILYFSQYPCFQL